METKNITSKLIKIQSELKAPKGQFNSFGKYKYRNCEDILEAVKPLLAEAELSLLITDDIVQVGDRYYVKATVNLSSGDQAVEVSAFAREAENKKGMDESQITGASSSYARKYALNGLFLIDDTKDADSQKPSEKPKTSPSKPVNPLDTKKLEIKKLCDEFDPLLSETKEYPKFVKSLVDLDLEEKNYDEIINRLLAKKDDN